MNEILLGIVVLALLGMVFMMFKYSKFIHHFPNTGGDSGTGDSSSEEKNDAATSDDVSGDSGGGDAGGGNGGGGD